jgi:hypothetical protein
MFGLPTEAIGAVVAAIIAGLVAFFSLIISKEQTVSNFRQQWIDALREDIASVISYTVGIHGESVVKRKTDEELWVKVKEDFTHFHELAVRIKLRLNPEEKRKKEKEATSAVLKAVDRIDEIFSSPEPGFHELEEIIATLVKNSQVILKENWKRVRSGEPVYWVTKWAAFTLAVLAAVWLIAHKLGLV